MPMQTSQLLNQMLVYYTDDLAYLNKKPIDEIVFTTEYTKLLIKKFKTNKISLERLSPLIRILSEESSNMIIEQKDKDIILRQQWDQMVKYSIDLFKKHGVLYILFKALDYPWAILSDIDILPLNPIEELKALEALHDEGFTIYEFRLLTHPLKLKAMKIDNNIAIDFYPEPEWYRKKVSDTDIVFSRMRSIFIKNTETFIPSIEDSIYLIGTHAYNHLVFTLAEILHGLNLTSKTKQIDWKYLYNLAYNYGTLDAIYFYLKSLQLYSITYRKESCINEQVLSSYEKNSFCRHIKSWFNKIESIELPISVPSRIGCINSSIYNITKMFGLMPLTDLSYNFLSHYLSMSNRIVHGHA